MILLQRLQKELESLGLQLLDKTNLVIDVDNFYPEKSEVTLKVIPKSEAWQIVTKSNEVNSISKDMSENLIVSTCAINFVWNYRQTDRQPKIEIIWRVFQILSLFQRKKLCGVIDIFDGHFCKQETARDAATFDLSRESLMDTFYAVLDVILHAVTSLNPNESIDISEDMAITVKKVSQIILGIIFMELR